MRGSVITTVILMVIAFIMIGVGLSIGGPLMLTGFDTMINATNASTFTGFTTTAKAGPTLIILGFIIAIAVVGFLGIKVASSKKGE